MRKFTLTLVTVAGVLLGSCRDATQVNVMLRTNVPYAAGNEVALWSSRSGALGVPLAQSAEPWLSEREVGNLVVVPGEGAEEGALVVRVAMGVRGKRAADCRDEGDTRGCIIARRKLAFVPHTGLRLPIVMYLACEGVTCSQDTTCSYLGQCVPADVDPAACARPEGCLLPGEPPFEPGGNGGGGGPVGTGSAQLTAGETHTCARLETGTIKCWGLGPRGALGYGDTQPRGDEPGEMGASLPIVDLGPGRTALEVAAGYDHTCARLDGGTVKCWGRNDDGQLGTGDTQERGSLQGTMGASLSTVDLGPGRTALQLAAGFQHTCARLDDGSVKCWGRNTVGQLGLGDTQDRGDGPGELGASLPAVDLGPGRTALQITAGYEHTCARLDDGTVKCWGVNLFGQLGLGDQQRRGDGPGEMGAVLPAVDLGPGRTAAQVVAGSEHTCAQLDNGTVRCWGRNGLGQLGLGDTQSRGDGPGEMGPSLARIDLGPGRTALQLVAGNGFTCARLDDGALKCWGRNFNGQLGLGDSQNRGGATGQMGANLPAVSLGAGRTVQHVAAGTSHVCARLDDGTVKCWGQNGSGQLGLGDQADRGDDASEMGAALPTVLLQ